MSLVGLGEGYIRDRAAPVPSSPAAPQDCMQRVLLHATVCPSSHVLLSSLALVHCSFPEWKSPEQIKYHSAKDQHC